MQYVGMQDRGNQNCGITASSSLALFLSPTADWNPSETLHNGAGVHAWSLGLH
jgi:hypothetical protein